MARPLRWGILSTASINAKVLTGAALSGCAEVIAVSSRTQARADEYAARWGIPQAYAGYDRLLADAAVDAVYISLPNGLHHEWTMRALEAGKHVLCEKPYSRWPDEVFEAYNFAQRRGLVLSEAFMFRYHPQMVRLVELVLVEGVIGEVRLVASSFSWPTETPADIRLSASLGGGSLLDVGVYCVSAGRLLAGEPRAVTAQQVVGPSGVDVAFIATLEYDSSAVAHFDAAIHLPDRSHLEVVGTSGTITVGDPWHCEQPRLTVSLQAGTSREVPVARANSYQLELEEFGKAVRGEPNKLLGLEDALGQARAVDALFQAADSGRRVEIDGGVST